MPTGLTVDGPHTVHLESHRCPVESSGQLSARAGAKDNISIVGQVIDRNDHRDVFAFIDERQPAEVMLIE